MFLGQKLPWVVRTARISLPPKKQISRHAELRSARLYVPHKMRRLTLDVATRVARMDRVEPQTRRASRGSSYRGLCRNRYVKIAQCYSHCRWRPWRRGTISRGVSCHGGSDPKAGGKACSEMLSVDVLLRSRANRIRSLQTAQEPRP